MNEIALEPPHRDIPSGDTIPNNATISASTYKVHVPPTHDLLSPKPRPGEWMKVAFDRIESFHQIQPNWDSYGADAPQYAIVESAKSLLIALVQQFDLPKPFISPTRMGGVLFEWKSGDCELEVELVSRDAISFYFTDTSTGVEHEEPFFNDQAASPQILADLNRMSQ